MTRRAACEEAVKFELLEGEVLKMDNQIPFLVLGQELGLVLKALGQRFSGFE
jgi:hypothetical protein